MFTAAQRIIVVIFVHMLLGLHVISEACQLYLVYQLVLSAPTHVNLHNRIIQGLRCSYGEHYANSIISGKPSLRKSCEAMAIIE